MQRTLFIAHLVILASVLSGSQFHLPLNCDDIYRYDNSSSSGVYTIFPGGPTTPLHVYCDMNSDGGRWTVFQRRIDGSENFYRSWAHYKTGFGNVAGEYWLGLENIFLLTMRKKNELRVDLEDWNKDKAYALYESVSVDSENFGYQLRLGKYRGGYAGDSLSNHDNMKFTTFDKDQDQWDKNCAQYYLGGFWYNACHMANPNGMYAADSPIGFENVQIVWYNWREWNYSLKSISMKIRPISKCPCKQ